MQNHPEVPQPPMDIRIEVRPSPGQRGDLSASAKLTETLANRVGEINATVNYLAEAFAQGLGHHETPNGQWSLSTAEISLSLDLEAEAGVILSRFKSAAGIEVTLTWTSDKDRAE